METFCFRAMDILFRENGNTSVRSLRAHKCDDLANADSERLRSSSCPLSAALLFSIHLCVLYTCKYSSTRARCCCCCVSYHWRVRPLFQHWLFTPPTSPHQLTAQAQFRPPPGGAHRNQKWRKIDFPTVRCRRSSGWRFDSFLRVRNGRLKGVRTAAKIKNDGAPAGIFRSARTSRVRRRPRCDAAWARGPKAALARGPGTGLIGAETGAGGRGARARGVPGGLVLLGPFWRPSADLGC